MHGCGVGEGCVRGEGIASMCRAGMSLWSQISAGTIHLQQESPRCWQPEGLPSFSDRKTEVQG